MIKTTLFVVCYNHENFIKDSLHSAFNQDYPNLDIIISDDNSTDNSFKIIQNEVKKYRGSHNIIINRNKKNLGMIEHNNHIIFNLIKTTHFIPQGGDDISEPTRVSEVMKFFKKNKDVYAICSNVTLLENNIKTKPFINPKLFTTQNRDFNDIIKKGTQFFGVGSAYNKILFEKFGKLKTNVRNEDQILPYRATILGKVGYIEKCLVQYRIHDNNLSLWIKKRTVSNREKLQLDKLNYINQITNLENFIEDITLIEGESSEKIPVILKKISFFKEKLIDLNIINFFLQTIDNNKLKKLSLWGINHITKELLKYIEDDIVISYIDTKMAAQNLSFNQMEVITLDKSLEYKNNHILIISNKSRNKMEKILLNKLAQHKDKNIKYYKYQENIYDIVLLKENHVKN